MSKAKSDTIKAIELVRSLFEHIHGNLGLLSFSIEELKVLPKESESSLPKYEIICSFFETLGSDSQSKYTTVVDMANKEVTVKKIGKDSDGSEKVYTFEEKEQ